MGYERGGLLVGTNYYLGGRQLRTESSDPDIHLGKTSAAGLWCWDCNISLLKSGRIHYDAKFRDTCPQCGQGPHGKHFWDELFSGFDASGHKRHGVMACYSFLFAQSPSRVFGYNPDRLVKDEYGKELTMREFWQVVEKARYTFTNSVGKRFS